MTLAHQVDLSEPLGLPPCAPSQPVNGASDEVVAEARAQWVATKRSAWYHADGGPALFQEARVGRGRRIQIVDPTHVEGPRETGTSEGSGGVPNDDGTRCRGDKWATWRPL